ncbi:MAG: hypothetical protein ACLUOI_20295 [Eisenbergiella sp.]
MVAYAYRNEIDDRTCEEWLKVCDFDTGGGYGESWNGCQMISIWSICSV